MGAKKILATIDSLAQFEQHVRDGRPCIWNLPLSAGALAGLRAEIQAFIKRTEKFAVFVGDTCDMDEVCGADFQAQFESGQATYNVLEHTVDAALREKLFVPAILASTERNLFRNLEGVVNPYSLVASPMYSHTVPHVDSGAYGNWMVLASGKKLWMLVTPEDEPLYFSPHTRTWTFDDEYKTDRIHYGMLEAGQLLYSPPGWAHSVITLETSLGYGGQYLGRDDIGCAGACRKP